MANSGLNVYLDLLPNQPKNDKTRGEFRKVLLDRFEGQLNEAVERIWNLPPLILELKDDAFEPYTFLLLEARELYVHGHFYSCVAMCGVVGERLVKDVLRTSVFIKKDGQDPGRPPDVAFDQLERVEVSGLVRFLKEADLLSSRAAKAAEKLSELRNSYAHARGKNPHDDALKAIEYLHEIVEDTVSVFKRYDIREGVFVPKT